MMKNRRWVFGDLHGAYKALVQIMERAPIQKGDTIISLGDICDGWSDVYNCVEYLINMQDDYNMIFLKGNHDDWFLEYLQGGINPVAWQQGGVATAKSYLREIDKEHLIQVKSGGEGFVTALNPGDVPPLHQEFFRSQHLYYKDDDNNIFVHGGFDRNFPIKGQSRYIYYWDRHLWYEAMSVKGKDKLKFAEKVNKVYIGHTSVNTWHNPYALPLLEGGGKVWNLDTGAGEKTGKLTIMDIDTNDYWQSDFLEILYPKEKGRG